MRSKASRWPPGADHCDVHGLLNLFGLLGGCGDDAACVFEGNGVDAKCS